MTEHRIETMEEAEERVSKAKAIIKKFEKEVSEEEIEVIEKQGRVGAIGVRK